ncbi:MULTISPECIES: MFS transporter [Mycetohabitans]
MTKPLFVILATVMLDAAGIGLIMPILPALLRSLGGTQAGSSAHYGILLALYALMQFVFAPILGALSDRFGRRPVLLLSLAGAATDYVVMAWAPSLPWLYVGRALSGITGATAAVATAYITDITPEPRRAQRFGQLSAMMGVGLIGGPLLGGLLGALHLRAPFVAAAVMNGLNLLLALLVLPESRHVRGTTTGWKMNLKLNWGGSLNRLGAGTQLPPLIGIYATIVVASQVPATLWILYGQDQFGWGASVAGLSLAGYGACHALSQAFVIGPLVGRVGEWRSLLLGVAADAAGLALLAVASSAWVPFALLPLFAAGGMTMPALQAMIARQVSDEAQGELQGALASLSSLIGVGGPVAVTAVYAWSVAWFPGLAWALGAASYLLVVPWLFSARMRGSAVAATQVSRRAP